MKMGNCYDKLNNRKKALEFYNKVLNLKDHNGSHNTAKMYIRDAYK